MKRHVEIIIRDEAGAELYRHVAAVELRMDEDAYGWDATGEMNSGGDPDPIMAVLLAASPAPCLDRITYNAVGPAEVGEV